MKTIAIDFDGVIHKYSKGWHDGTAYDVPMEGAIEGLKLLMKNYAVYIFSARDPQVIQDWFARNSDIGTLIIRDKQFWDTNKILGISNKKIPAIAYVDDRGIRFVNWEDVLNYF